MPPPRGSAASSSGSGGEPAATGMTTVTSATPERFERRSCGPPRGCGKAGKVVHSGCRARLRRAWLPTPLAISSCVGLQSRLPPDEVGPLSQGLFRCRSPSPMPGRATSSGRRLGL